MFYWVRVLISRLRGRLSMGRVDKEFQRELDEHLEMLTAEGIRRGLAPEAARREIIRNCVAGAPVVA